jgi:hypothetical protein
MATPNYVPRWVWYVAGVLLVAVPIVVSLAVPSAPTGANESAAPKHWTDPSGQPTRVPPPATPAPQVAGDATALATEASAASGAPTSASPADPTLDALAGQMAELRAEKEAIEAESVKLGKTRTELENFEQEHPDGVTPELYSRYEDARKTYNSDVMAFKSRTAAYQMRLAAVERRVDSLQNGAYAPIPPSAAAPQTAAP